MKRVRGKAIVWPLLLAGLLVGCAGVAATMGFISVSLGEVARIIGGHLFGQQNAGGDPVAATVVIDVRMPRIVAAILVGGVLAVSGAVLQAVLLNPLADSYTLGISTGAAFGASLIIVLQLAGLSLPPSISIPVFAFVGGVATLAAVLYLAAGDRSLASTSLILAGVIVAAILSAAIGFLKFVANEQVGVIIFWLLGSLSGASWTQVSVLIGFGFIGMVVVMTYSRDLNIMAAGERAAASLGVNPVRLRLVLLVTCTLMTSVAVSVAGIIGFVGLIVPHLLRHMVGPDNRQLVPLSFLGGGLLLLVADTLTRAVLPAEVPIGVLTALLGGPFFCVLFSRQGDGRASF